MAKRVVYKCDRCGKEFDRRRIFCERVSRRHKVKITSFYELGTPFEDHVDLCQACSDQLDEFLKYRSPVRNFDPFD